MNLRQMADAWRGGRGTTKYVFDAASIARAVGLSTERVRELIRRKVVDPSNLLSLARFVTRSETEATVARAVIAAGGDMDNAAAALGVSRSTLYRRAKGSPST